jgi:hypothetical protein
MWVQKDLCNLFQPFNLSTFSLNLSRNPQTANPRNPNKKQRATKQENPKTWRTGAPPPHPIICKYYQPCSLIQVYHYRSRSPFVITKQANAIDLYLRVDCPTVCIITITELIYSHTFVCPTVIGSIVRVRTDYAAAFFTCCALRLANSKEYSKECAFQLLSAMSPAQGILRYVDAYIHIPINIPIRIHSRAHTHIHMLTHTHTRIHIHVHIIHLFIRPTGTHSSYSSIYSFIDSCICPTIHPFIHKNSSIYMHRHIHIPIHIYTYIHTHIQIHTHAYAYTYTFTHTKFIRYVIHWLSSFIHWFSLFIHLFIHSAYSIIIS